MKKARISNAILGVACLAALIAANVPAGAQTTDLSTTSPRSARQSQRGVNQPPPVPIEPTGPVDTVRIRHFGRPVLRIWQNYTLPAGESVRHVVVILGDATIDGHVNEDLVVILGHLRLGTSAVVDGDVVVVSGNATVVPGAVVRGDFVVAAGMSETPPAFSPGGGHVVVGSTLLGDRLRHVLPWITRGLLWGRLIVPDLAWVWGFVAFFVAISLLINVLFHGPVGACADTLSKKPFSAFLVGLLVLLLVGPVSLLLIATVVGIVVVPFLWCALLLAWTIGKVGVARWIGRSITRRAEPETVLQGLASVVVGLVIIYVLYWIPVLGLFTWCVVGVFGLGTATMTFLAALRRERPAPPAVEPTPLPPAPPAPPSAPIPPPIATPGTATAYSSLGDSVRITEGTEVNGANAAVDLRPLRDRAATAALPVSPLVAMPRAGFLDRMAGFVLDAVLVLMAVALLDVERFDNGLYFIALFSYFVGFWAWKGTSIGGLVCNLRLIRTDGQPLQFADALVRGLSSLFSVAALGLGFLWILRDPERQAWHDKIAGTLVVRVPRAYPLP